MPFFMNWVIVLLMLFCWSNYTTQHRSCKSELKGNRTLQCTIICHVAVDTLHICTLHIHTLCRYRRYRIDIISSSWNSIIIISHKCLIWGVALPWCQYRRYHVDIDLPTSKGKIERIRNKIDVDIVIMFTISSISTS